MWKNCTYRVYYELHMGFWLQERLVPLNPTFKSQLYLDKSFMVFHLYHGSSSVAESRLTLLWPHGLAHQAPLSTVFSRQEYWSGHSIFQGIFPDWPRDQTCVSCISFWESIIMSRCPLFSVKESVLLRFGGIILRGWIRFFKYKIEWLHCSGN